MVFNSQLLAEVPECVVVELLSIIREEDPGDFEATNDAFPDEVSDVFLGDSGQGLYFNLFSEVVDSYDKELELLYCHGERSHYVEPLLSKWLGCVHWGELF